MFPLLRLLKNLADDAVNYRYSLFSDN